MIPEGKRGFTPSRLGEVGNTLFNGLNYLTFADKDGNECGNLLVREFSTFGDFLNEHRNGVLFTGSEVSHNSFLKGFVRLLNGGGLTVCRVLTSQQFEFVVDEFYERRDLSNLLDCEKSVEVVALSELLRSNISHSKFPFGFRDLNLSFDVFIIPHFVDFVKGF